MRVAQPVRGDGKRDARPPCRRTDDLEHLGGVEVPILLVADLLPGGKDGSLGGCPLILERLQFVPGGGGEQDGARLAALAEGGDLAGIAALLEVLPLEVTQFGDAQAAGVEQPEQDAVAFPWFEGEHLLDVGLRKDALGQSVPEAWQAEGAPDIHREDADAVAEGEEGLDAGEGAGARRGGELLLAQQVGKALHIGEGDLGQRLAGKVKEAAGVGSIGALGMTASSVEPEAEELGIGVP